MPESQPGVEEDRYVLILRQLGRAYLMRREYRQAYDKLKELLTIEPDRPETLRDAALAAIGLEAVDEEAIALYERADKTSTDDVALATQLAALFIRHQLHTPFAIRCIEKAAALHPENEAALREHLIAHYAGQDDAKNLQIQKEALLFAGKNAAQIRDYLEELWWNGRFDQAWNFLQRAPQRNGASAHAQLELALAMAYELRQQGKCAETQSAMKTLRSALSSLTPAASMPALQDYTLLHSVLPDDAPAQPPAENGVAEYELILKDTPIDEIFDSLISPAAPPAMLPPVAFDLQRDVLERLDPPAEAEASPGKAGLPAARSVLCLQFLPSSNEQQLPEELQLLVTDVLGSLKGSCLRLCRGGAVHISPEPAAQQAKTLTLLRQIEKFNAALPMARQIKLLAAQMAQETPEKSDRGLLELLVKCLHLLRLARRAAANSAKAGYFAVGAAGEKPPALARDLEPVVWHQNAPLLPGHSLQFAEVLWQNPLQRLQSGHHLKIGQVELTASLREHKGYLTAAGRNLQLGRPVLAKILRPGPARKLLEQPAVREGIYEKLRALGRFSHPNVAKLYDMGEYEQLPYFVRELVEGKNLGEMAFSGANREAQILDILLKLVRALDAACRAGILHLNLKPSNIWINEAQELKITDFYCEGFSEDIGKADLLYPAQWRYAAPEVLSGEPGTTQSDIYSIGILSYELLSGVHPYNRTASIKSPKDLRKAKFEALPENELGQHALWLPLVMTALAYEPAQRHASLAAVHSKLREIQLQFMQADAARAGESAP